MVSENKNFDDSDQQLEDYELPHPQVVGSEFVRQYYTTLSTAPNILHRFYTNKSSFVHGGLNNTDEEAAVIGQKAIKERIELLKFKDCRTKIRKVDSHATLANGIVIQVSGELSNNGKPMRRFMQTFVLGYQKPRKYFVINDIFCYQDEVFDDTESKLNTIAISQGESDYQIPSPNPLSEKNNSNEVFAKLTKSQVDNNTLTHNLMNGHAAPNNISGDGFYNKPFHQTTSSQQQQQQHQYENDSFFTDTFRSTVANAVKSREMNAYNSNETNTITISSSMQHVNQPPPSAINRTVPPTFKDSALDSNISRNTPFLTAAQNFRDNNVSQQSNSKPLSPLTQSSLSNQSSFMPSFLSQSQQSSFFDTKDSILNYKKPVEINVSKDNLRLVDVWDNAMYITTSSQSIISKSNNLDTNTNSFKTSFTTNSTTPSFISNEDTCKGGQYMNNNFSTSFQSSSSNFTIPSQSQAKLSSIPSTNSQSLYNSSAQTEKNEGPLSTSAPKTYAQLLKKAANNFQKPIPTSTFDHPIMTKNIGNTRAPESKSSLDNTTKNTKTNEDFVNQDKPLTNPNVESAQKTNQSRLFDTNRIANASNANINNPLHKPFNQQSRQFPNQSMNSFYNAPNNFNNNNNNSRLFKDRKSPLTSSESVTGNVSKESRIINHPSNGGANTSRMPFTANNNGNNGNNRPPNLTQQTQQQHLNQTYANKGDQPSSNFSQHHNNNNHPNVNSTLQQAPRQVGTNHENVSPSTMINTAAIPDSHQIFVGNLPHTMSEEELKTFFTQFGDVLDIKIKSGPKDGARRMPNFGFVIFDGPEPVKLLISQKPIIYNGHRLNVEEKKNMRPGGGSGPAHFKPSGGNASPNIVSQASSNFGNRLYNSNTNRTHPNPPFNNSSGPNSNQYHQQTQHHSYGTSNASAAGGGFGNRNINTNTNTSGSYTNNNNNGNSRPMQQNQSSSYHHHSSNSNFNNSKHPQSGSYSSGPMINNRFNNNQNPHNNQNQGSHAGPTSRQGPPIINAASN